MLFGTLHLTHCSRIIRRTCVLYSNRIFSAFPGNINLLWKDTFLWDRQTRRCSTLEKCTYRRRVFFRPTLVRQYLPNSFSPVLIQQSSDRNIHSDEIYLFAQIPSGWNIKTSVLKSRRRQPVWCVSSALSEAFRKALVLFVSHPDMKCHCTNISGWRYKHSNLWGRAEPALRCIRRAVCGMISHKVL